MLKMIHCLLNLVALYSFAICYSCGDSSGSLHICQPQTVFGLCRKHHLDHPIILHCHCFIFSWASQGGGLLRELVIETKVRVAPEARNRAGVGVVESLNSVLFLGLKILSRYTEIFNSPCYILFCCQSDSRTPSGFSSQNLCKPSVASSLEKLSTLTLKKKRGVPFWLNKILTPLLS